MKAIYCAGEQGRVILDSLRRSEDVDDVVFFDDDTNLHGTTIEGASVVGGMDAVKNADNREFIIAYGAGQEVRLQIAEELNHRDIDFFTHVDSDSTLSSRATIGSGVFVNAQSYIGPYVTLEEHVLVDSMSTISHDSFVTKGAIITPGATLAGDVTIGTDAYIGPGVTVLRGRTVGEQAVVGAGSVVINNVPPDTTVVGVPAQEVERA